MKRAKPSFRFFRSVGTKLAAITVLVIVAIAALVYGGLSRYERAKLLNAKEMAATMVSGLFNSSVAPALDFGSADEVQEQLNRLGANDEVVYASVWKTADKHTIGDQLGELRRGSYTMPAPGDIPAQVRTQLTTGAVILDAPIVGQNGRVQGVSRVAFSLAREEAATRVVGNRVLFISGACALLLSLLLLGSARLIIISPLAKLTLAARRLESGEHVEIAIDSDDEIGRLAKGFETMSRAVQAREQILSRNQAMRLVLDNVEQGLVTLDREGVMSKERSALFDRLFDAGHHRTFVECLEPIDSKLAEWFAISWEAIWDNVLPLELALAQLPKHIQLTDRQLEIEYRPIFENSNVDRILVVISDVTERHEHERIQRKQREMAAIFQRMLADRAGFQEFFDEGTTLVDRITKQGSSGASLERQIHTLKGNAAIFGITSVAEICHRLETEIIENFRQPTPDEIEGLSAAWTAVAEMAEGLGMKERQSIEIDAHEYEALLDKLRAHADYNHILSFAAALRYEPASARLARFAEHTRALAERLGREVTVECAPTRLRLPAERWSSFWSSFIHVVRNAVDHGIETPKERALAGKTPVGRVSLAIVESAGGVTVSLSDDGRGIDWTKLAEKAATRGLAHETRADLEEALYADHVSTRDEATETSGRGVGMSAVREAVRELGGRISIESHPGVGTTFRFVFPPESLVGGTGDMGRLDSKSGAARFVN